MPKSPTSDILPKDKMLSNTSRKKSRSEPTGSIVLNAVKSFEKMSINEKTPPIPSTSSSSLLPPQSSASSSVLLPSIERTNSSNNTPSHTSKPRANIPTSKPEKSTGNVSDKHTTESTQSNAISDPKTVSTSASNSSNSNMPNTTSTGTNARHGRRRDKQSTSMSTNKQTTDSKPRYHTNNNSNRDTNNSKNMNTPNSNNNRHVQPHHPSSFRKPDMRNEANRTIPLRSNKDSTPVVPNNNAGFSTASHSTHQSMQQTQKTNLAPSSTNVAVISTRSTSSKDSPQHNSQASSAANFESHSLKSSTVSAKEFEDNTSKLDSNYDKKPNNKQFHRQNNKMGNKSINNNSNNKIGNTQPNRRNGGYNNKPANYNNSAYINNNGSKDNNNNIHRDLRNFTSNQDSPHEDNTQYPLQSKPSADNIITQSNSTHPKHVADKPNLEISVPKEQTAENYDSLQKYDKPNNLSNSTYNPPSSTSLNFRFNNMVSPGLPTSPPHNTHSNIMFTYQDGFSPSVAPQYYQPPGFVPGSVNIDPSLQLQQYGNMGYRGLYNNWNLYQQFNKHQQHHDFNYNHHNSHFRNQNYHYPNYNYNYNNRYTNQKMNSMYHVYIGNIPFTTQWQELKDHLRAAGDIYRVEIPESFDGWPKGFALAAFQSEQGAQNAIDMFHDTPFQGRTLTVRFDKYGNGLGLDKDGNESKGEDSKDNDNEDETKANKEADEKLKKGKEEGENDKEEKVAKELETRPDSEKQSTSESSKGKEASGPDPSPKTNNSNNTQSNRPFKPGYRHNFNNRFHYRNNNGNNNPYYHNPRPNYGGDFYMNNPNLLPPKNILPFMYYPNMASGLASNTFNTPNSLAFHQGLEYDDQNLSNPPIQNVSGMTNPSIIPTSAPHASSPPAFGIPTPSTPAFGGNTSGNGTNVQGFVPTQFTQLLSGPSNGLATFSPKEGYTQFVPAGGYGAGYGIGGAAAYGGFSGGNSGFGREYNNEYNMYQEPAQYGMSFFNNQGEAGLDGPRDSDKPSSGLDNFGDNNMAGLGTGGQNANTHVGDNGPKGPENADKRDS